MIVPELPRREVASGQHRGLASAFGVESSAAVCFNVPAPQPETHRVGEKCIEVLPSPLPTPSL